MSARQDVIGVAGPLAVGQLRRCAATPGGACVAIAAVSILLVLGLVGCGTTPVQVPPASPTPRPAPTPGPAPTSFSLPAPPPHQFADLRQRVNPPQVSTPAPAALPPGDDPVGNAREFQVWPSNATTYLDAHVPLRARLLIKTDHAYWYVQDGLGLPDQRLHAAAEFFERHVYTTIHQTFGWDVPPGIDNDRRVTILIGHIPIYGNGVLTTAIDLLPQRVFPISNERKLIYVDADQAQLGSPSFNAAISNALTGIAWESSQPNQDFWVKDGLDLVATEDASGSLDGILDASATSVFALYPQTQLNARRPGGANWLAGEAACYLFARYVGERFGSFPAFPRVFAASERGMAAYDQFFRSYLRPTTFDDVFGDWVAANVLNDPTLDDGHFGYRSNLKVNVAPPAGPTLGESVAGQATQFGATYYQVTPTATATLAFTGDRTIPLVAANPREGGYEWWSNGGDLIDSRLTRAVDLRTVATATLRFWTWYETEKDYDYAYVEVSIDAGATWRTLPATDTTRDNPYQKSLGDSFTGTSGGSPPRWVQETADLTRYAGRQLLLRFEYVTDPAIQGDGFVLDGVEIPEINFHDDATSDNGWMAEGFVRTDNLEPQPWLVEVISRDPKNPVQRVAVAPDGTGSFPLAAGQSVIVAIAGLAPNTTQKATYQLRLVAR